ncbi:protein obstructor-E [Sitodiplosis mosellana]|uniref:protein obstructor-E n=1 Tax=Sitodiplosis mosellana TaxID=263140 RepID=UPI002443B63E|nr:protein obstructor-E [Sitodiplosis mosellana]
MTTSRNIIQLGLIVLLVGLVASQEEATTKRSSFLHRKPSRNYRTKAPQKPTRPTPAAISEDDDEEYHTSPQCPEPDGFFADSEQCDKYYACSDGQMTEKLCPDGMVFNDYSSDQEKCDLPYNLDCSKRPKLQEPKPSLNCPRRNGYFAHKGSCDKFYYCVDGMYNMIVCPAGLVFNPRTGICTWPDEAQKKGCSSEELFKFICPKVDEGTAATHPRYADPEDCQYFYVCINGEQPRRNGCKLGQAFDDVSKRCEWARKIPECADWYKDILTDKQLDELENPPTTEKPIAKKVSSRRKHPKLRQRQQDEQEAERLAEEVVEQSED